MYIAAPANTAGVNRRSAEARILRPKFLNRRYDVVVVGSGPNGLSAAVVAARCGLSTVLFEGAETLGGAVRSAEITVPGFRHDTCSAVHPMARASSLFRHLPLGQHGLTWITPPAAAAHPLDGGDAVILGNDLEATAASLGADRDRYLRTIGTVTRDWPRLEADIMGPIGFPSHPLLFARFGAQSLLPAQRYARMAFRDPRAKALFAGCAAHAIVPFSFLGSAAIALALSAVGHVYGWPIPRGGSQAITDALASYFRSLGGEIVTGTPIETHRQLPETRILLFDTGPRALARIMGDRMPAGYRGRLERYRYGPGVFKVDWALREPIPWQARQCLTAATVHVGGTLEEIALAERSPWIGEPADRPFVLLTQPSLFDPSRAPNGHHTAWGYCHVPNGSVVEMTERIEAQVERFAPGFRDVVLARSVRSPAQLERENANLVGGDVGGGSNELQNLVLRPSWRMYATPVAGVYLCSASTPPGAGVHGMCGFHAARRAIRDWYGPAVWDRGNFA